MITFVLVVLVIASFYFFGIPVARLIMPERFDKYDLVVAPIIGIPSHMLVAQFISQAGLTGRTIVIITLLIFVALWVYLIYKKRVQIDIKGSSLRPFLLSLVVLLLGAWPMFYVGYDAFMAFVNPDAVSYVADTEYLQDHSLSSVPPDLSGQPYLQYAKSYASTHRRIGSQFTMLYMSQLTGIGLQESFNIVAVSFLLLFPIAVFIFARIGVGLSERASLVAAALASLASLTPFSFLSQSLGSLSASVLLPTALAFVPRAVTSGDPTHRNLSILLGVGLLYAYFPGFPFLAVPAIVYGLWVGIKDRSSLKRNLRIALAAIAVLIVISPTHFIELLRLLSYESFSARQSISLAGDELLLGFGYALTEQFLPVFWGMAYYPFGVLMPYAESIPFAVGLIVLAVLLSLITIVALVRFRSVYHDFLLFVAVTYLLIMILQFAQNNGYGMLKVAIWIEFLKVSLVAISLYQFSELFGAKKAAKPYQLAVLLCFVLYVGFNIYSTMRLTMLTIVGQPGIPYVNWTQYPQRNEITSLRHQAAAVSGTGSILIGLQQLLPQWWAQYFLRDAMVSILQPVQLSPSNRIENVSPPNPATDRYLLTWTDSTQDVVDQKNARIVWQNRQFRMYDLESARNFVFPGLNWYAVESKKQGRSRLWQRFRWIRGDAQLLLLNPTSDSLRLKMTLWAGYGLTSQKRTIDLFLNGKYIERFHLNGLSSYISAPFRPASRLDTLVLKIHEKVNPLPRIWGLWNTWVPRDSRRLNVGATDVTILTSEEYDRLGYPSSATIGDLEHGDSPEFNGVTFDGWILDTATVMLRRDPEHNAFHISGEIPKVGQGSPYALKVFVDKNFLTELRFPTAANFDTTVLLPPRVESHERVRISIVPSFLFKPSDYGINDDQRALGFRLHAASFEKVPTTRASRDVEQLSTDRALEQLASRRKK